MFEFLRQRADYREYRQTVNDCLTVLFCGFPGGLLHSLTQGMDLEGLVRDAHVKKEDPKECSIYATTILLGKLVEPMSVQEREDAYEAFKEQDGNHPLYKGINYMLQVAEQFRVNDQLLALLSYEILGQLRGLTRDEIDSWRMEAE